MDNEMTYVAVYGTLMEGERNERWRKGIKTFARGMIDGTLVDTGCGFPAFIPNSGWNRRNDVMCEVLEVTDAELRHMDVLEGCPSLYRRERVSVDVGDDESLTAWVYVMNRIPDMAVTIDSGDWKSYRQQNEDL